MMLLYIYFKAVKKIINFKLLFFFLFSLFLYSCAVKEICIFKTLPDNVTYEMRRPYFWISKLKDPDRIIMSYNEIKFFNENIAKKKLTLPFDTRELQLKSDYIKENILWALEYFKIKPYYFHDSMEADKDFFADMEDNINIKNFRENYIKYGIVSKFASQRLLPTDTALFSAPDKFFFDRLQNNGFDIGNFLLILHESKDKLWYYTISEYSSGWIKKENIALCSFDDFSLLNNSRFIVVTEAKADIFSDRQLSDYWQTIRMGNRLTLLSDENGVYKVLLPIRNKKGFLQYKYGYISRRDANIGYLGYTQKNVILQSFKFLNTPYGWGDMYMEQDCSKFIQEIFFTFGFKLPRNSSAQTKFGDIVYNRDLKQKLHSHNLENLIYTKAKAGITLLQLQGHIMLYIGNQNGKNYVIHDTFGYNEKINGRIYTNVVNKVEVTTLDIGESSESGSLLDRIKNVVILDLND